MSKNNLSKIKSIKENKKGQREVSFGTMLLVIIGVVGLILVGLGFLKGWSIFPDLFDLTPDKIDQIAEGSCRGYVQSGSQQMFCTSPVKVDGQKYVTCDFIHEEYRGLEDITGAEDMASKCDDEGLDYEKACKRIVTTEGIDTKDEFGEIEINGEKCSKKMEEKEWSIDLE